MPVIGISVDLLEKGLIEKMDRDTLILHLQHLGCDVEGFAILRRFRCNRCGHIAEITETQEPPVLCGGCGLSFKDHPDQMAELDSTEVLRMELLAVRPDLFDPGGLARTLNAYLGHRVGLKEYDIEPPAESVTVDPSTQTDLCPRPAIAAAMVSGITLDDDFIKVVMKLQENLHWALGRDRKHASIGVYDLDTVTGPFEYTSVEPDALTFVPLGCNPEETDSAMTPAQILEKHPKGVAFAKLLDGFRRYPILRDSTGRILSMPPIINSEQTRVRQTTSGFFMDVTGTNQNIVNKALAVMVTSIKELQPDVAVQQVTVRYPDHEIDTPDLTPATMLLDPQATASLLGIDLDRDDVVRLLECMGHRTQVTEDDRIDVVIPAYRSDIIHPRDLMEDVAIAFGYHNIETSIVPTLTIGAPDPEQERAADVRQVMTGFGFLEVMTLALTSDQEAFIKMRLDEDPNAVILENPISAEQTMLRLSLLPGLLDTLAHNTNRELPQKLFEVGPTSHLDESAETGAREHLVVSAVLIDSKAGAADARSLCKQLLVELGRDPSFANASLGCYLDGRCGIVSVSGRPIGHLGEIHPEVLEHFGLSHPAAAFELDLSLFPR
ncbi:MAG: phenylalanine--tRNA ligase subunit beta [Deltaproteobacteria bacterium]|nr:phenylalanine--tRNA ligase subunit beta [Deltaproteobacteria bacterium]